MRTDAELVLAVRAGDDSALADLYDRYATPIHDFCASVLRDPHEAADAMQDTFVAVATRIDQLRDPAKLRSWLFAIARHEALRRGKRRRRARPTEGVGTDVADAGASPEDTVTGRAAAADAVAIVWDAAAGLADRDRVLLDLHLRQGLDGAELAEAIGSTPEQAYVMMSRLRGQVERSIGALLVARRGRAECDDLQVLLGPWDGTFSPLWRKRVARHVEHCETCEDTRRRVLPLYGATPALAAPAALRGPVLDAMRRARAAGAPPAWGADGYPPPLVARPGRRRGRAVAASAVALLVVGGAAVLVADPGGRVDTDRPPAAAGPELPALPTTTVDPGPPATAPVAPTVPETVPVVRTAPGPDPTVPPTAAPDTTGPEIAGPSAAPGLITWPRQCPPPYSSTVSATVTDASGVTSVTARVSSVYGVSTTTLTGGPVYSVTVGPHPDLVERIVTITVTFVAVDGAGNSTSASTTVTWSSGC